MCYFAILSFIGGERVHVPNWGHSSFGPVCMEFWVLRNTNLFFFLSVYFTTEKQNWNKHEAALLKRNNFEDLSHCKIRFLWIAINFHWNDCLLSYKYSIFVNDSHAKTNINAFVIIYSNCWNLVTILRLRNFKVVFFCWKGNFFLCV